MPDIPDRESKEKLAARLIGRLQRAQQTEILKRLGNPPKIENIPLEDWDELGADFLAEAAPLLSKFFLAAAEEMIRDLPYGVDWALVNQRAVEWVGSYGFDLVKGIMETTRTALQENVGRYYSDGWTIGQLEDSISGLFGPVRAEMIAVTEVTRASTEGERAIAAELAEQGIQMRPIWNTNYDELVCDICEPRNQEPIEGDDYPPAHPRCRCWTSHELITEPEAEQVTVTDTGGAYGVTDRETLIREYGVENSSQLQTYTPSGTNAKLQKAWMSPDGDMLDVYARRDTDIRGLGHEEFARDILGIRSDVAFVEGGQDFSGVEAEMLRRGWDRVNLGKGDFGQMAQISSGRMNNTALHRLQEYFTDGKIELDKYKEIIWSSLDENGFIQMPSREFISFDKVIFRDERPELKKLEKIKQP